MMIFLLLMVSYPHKMIKYDAYRYMSHGAEIKKDIENGKSF